MRSARPEGPRPRLLRLLAVLGAVVALLGCGRSASAVGAPGEPSIAASTTSLAPSDLASAPHPANAPTSLPPTPVVRLARKPSIVASPIPFGPRRKAEMLAYAQRHYHLHTYHLIHPRVIVEHYTDTSTYGATFNTFAPDVSDSELHELPGTCSHYVIDKDGTIHQLVALSIMCRHTVGLNWTAIGIELVGFSDREILGRPRQLQASLALTLWLRCRYRIGVENVIGHSESLSSPFHHEEVAALRGQTHGDWTHADMGIYRARLRSLGGCRG